MLQAHPDLPDRKTRILDAAERCFVREGFHKATMQDIAAEAGMSAGNLYRTFPSKDALVEGLCERDRRDVAADFAAFDGDGDFMANFVALGRKHFEDEPRDKAVLCLQIWAEAARSPAVAGHAAAFAEDVTARLTELLDKARAEGRVHPGVDPRAVALLIMTLADGLLVRRAVVPSFDAAREVPAVLNLIGAVVSGGLAAACVAPVETAP
ncbi:TetR/AcrR family transcriptional regulator [Enterovirga sp.]|jgi:TetR/AcrR family transcriptional repressor of uid operon|uniref:TetR/AcrR family transcriptional regulator n=1 Tax=Enterovirga sp. TaxID=2026350 RepID=UPI002601AD90|nr:TetR/AcrR family transcriptional regulator [Enterovirga sp.]MDB5592272.1 TetR family transcriptional regulator [Enterovirga sp.]